MKKIIQFLTSKIKHLVFLYFLIQLTLIYSTDIEFHSDALYYYNLAQECLQENKFYPAEKHLYEDYIVAPFYINTIIILLTVYNSTITISLFNLIIILLQILILYKITLKIFSKHIAQLSVLLYIFYLNTLGLMLLNFTELFFLILLSAAIYFFLLNKNINLIFAGIMLGSAIAVRPAAWALLTAFILFHFLTIYKSRKFSFEFLYVYAGVVIFIFCFGGWINSHFGKFEFTSTTGPVNLLLGANDDATGGFNSTVYEKGKAGYIGHPDSLTYIQKGELYQDQAFKWIAKNPVKWISLAPLKLLHTFGWDDIALSPLIGYHETNFGRAVKNLFTGYTSDVSFLYFLILSLNHIYYYLIMIAIVLGIIQLVKNKVSQDEINLILLYSLISIMMIMITVGTPRYKYPIIILLLPFAAHYIQMKLGIKEQVADNEYK